MDEKQKESISDAKDPAIQQARAGILLHVSIAETRFFQHQIRILQQKLPPLYGYQPYYPVRCWDFEDMFRSLRNEAIEGRDRIWILLLERCITGKWPKAKREDSFWLRQRLSSALLICEKLLRDQEELPVQPISPARALEASKWLF